MTIKELKNHIKDLDDNTPVQIDIFCHGLYQDTIFDLEVNSFVRGDQVEVFSITIDDSLKAL